MKHSIFKYITIAAALLATAVNAGAQYNIEGGVGTSKQVTGPDSNGDYTIRLETFATGTSTVTETATPVDVVLVLDVSGSMAWPKGTATRTSKTTFSYNDIANGSVDYFRTYNNYTEQIFAGTYTQNGQTRYFLYVSPDVTLGNNSGGYLTERGATTNNRANAAYSTDPNATIVTTYNNAWFGGWDNRSSFYEGTSRIHALKDAIDAFIDEIATNDVQDKAGKPRDENLGNRISIIKFASNTSNTVGNTSYTTGGNTYNYTQVVNHFLGMTEANIAQMKADVAAFVPRGATEAGDGMDLANTELASANAGSNKVVVMFTDGAPTDDYDAIGEAKTIKDDGALVFSIGVFDSTPSQGNNPPTSGSAIWRYMNYVSSNYPNATGISTPGTGGDYTKGYYQDASTDEADLTEIFKSIASGIGTASATVGTSTQVRDVVTNSFVLPDNVSAADVHVYTSEATGSASGADDTNPAGWATPVEITSVTKNIVNVDANGNPTNNANEVKNKALFIEGFDYSLADSEGADGTTAHPYGNWVGPRYKNGDWIWAGKKLIITFKVKADPESTGGESLTNTGKSGVYVLNEDGETYTCINNYEQPHTTLSVNIKIRKTGLRHGESATFELMRIRPKGYNPDGATLQDKVANLEYNIIGKPIPDTHPYSGSATQPDMSDLYEGMGWQGFKKVILTNKGDDGDEVVKIILALDPYWVYLVLEDDWGWAYTMTGDTNQVGEDGTYTTSSVEVNPFRFHNTEEADAVKHAEAIMINHFQSSDSASYTEHTKSSKVESF